MSQSKAILLLLAFAGLVGVVALLLPRIPQPLFYGRFADQREWLGIPNFANVGGLTSGALIARKVYARLRFCAAFYLLAMVLELLIGMFLQWATSSLDTL